MSQQTHRISLYRLKDNKRPNDLELTAAGYDLVFSNSELKLFLKAAHESTPPWLKFLAAHLDQSHLNLKNRSASFVLLNRRADRTYAVTGGFGYLQIEKHAESDFGVEVAKRMIPHDSIKAISQRVPRGEVRQVFRTFSEYDPIRDRDNFMRVLQSLYGRGSFEGKSFRVEGKTSIVLRTQKSASDLGSIIDEVEEVLAREPSVKLIQSFDVVEEAETINTLTALLEPTVLKFWCENGPRDTFYVEFADPLTQFRATSFKIGIGRRNVEVDDFELELIRKQLSQIGINQITSDELRRMWVEGRDDNGALIIARSRIWDHLIGEVEYEGRDYLRFASRWLRLRNELRDSLNQQLQAIPILRNELPNWDKATHATEALYNRWVAERMHWQCLDQDFVPLEHYSRLELCDLFDRDNNRFFHIKETWGSKSSYLFSQGEVAGEFLSNDIDFRAKCISKWPFLSGFNPSTAGIIFGIAVSPDKLARFPHNLTYFAKLSLCSAVESLRRLGYSVALTPIKIEG
jgi:uncharacterized protein (TIGR04141 family)